MRILTYVLTVIMMSCTSNLHFRDSFHKSVAITKKDGTIEEGTVADIEGNTITFVSGKTKKFSKINTSDIESIVELDKFYDNKGYPITATDITRYKSSSNTILYSVLGVLGGGLVGGLVGGIAGGDDPQKGILIGATIVGATGGIYGASVGDRSDIKKAVARVRLRREALDKIQKEKKKKK